MISRIVLPLLLIAGCIPTAFGQTRALDRQEFLIEVTTIEVARSDLRDLDILPTGSGQGFAMAIPDATARYLAAASHSTVLHRLLVPAVDRNGTQFRIGTRTPASGPAKGYFDVGIALDVTPALTLDREMSIVAAARLEVFGGDANNPPISLFSSPADPHEIRLTEGDTLILGGFIPADAAALEIIAPLQDNPILRSFFSSRQEQQEGSEIVVMLASHVWGSPDPAPADLESPGLDSAAQPDSLITPEPPAPAPPLAVAVPNTPKAAEKPKATPPARSARPARYTVQVGAFANPANAQALRRSLETKYSAVFIEKTAGARTLYRVRIGRVADTRTAKQLETKLRQQGFHPFIASL